MLNTASTELTAGNLYNSAKLQRTGRDSLREIARLVTVLEDNATELRKASDELGRTIDAQKKLADQTKDAKDDKEKTAAADKSQAKIVDKTDTTRKEPGRPCPGGGGEDERGAGQDAVRPRRSAQARQRQRRR